MSSRPQARPTIVSRVALVGLFAGAAGSSLMGPRILAGYAAVGLAVGVGLTLNSFAGLGRLLPVLGGGLAITYPLAAVEQGEDGILWAAALTVVVMAAAFLVRRPAGGVVGALAVSVAVVLHLGLLGSYLVLVAATGTRLLAALVLMAVAFEAAYAVAVARSGQPGGRRPSGDLPPASYLNPTASLCGVAACVAAGLLARLFLPSPPGIVSTIVLGLVVGTAAALGHAAAAITSEDLNSGEREVEEFDAGAFTFLNALLFAAGAFYYGFRLYLT
ncbi:MAG: hypothetical protein WD178_07370 [Actinomycetota bacterium]